ncbi:MAG TPA: C40 family peptidase [Bacteroidales bacterium]|nr:C40 family peptidase [Bacteroidales bacterium]HPS62688.1 C40 family peptidase [Bacteroidales bacterium]
MENGICLQSAIPVRSEPAHRAEMVTQLLFGELYLVTASENGWHRIRSHYDGYEGWISSLQANPVEEEEYQRLIHISTPVTLDLVQLLSSETSRSLVPLVLGSSLPGYDGSRFRIGNNHYFYEGQVSAGGDAGNDDHDRSSDPINSRLISDAMLYLNAPYQWGGRSPFGIDCSGFTQMVCKLQGIPLLRDASQQATQGEIVPLLEEAEPGDLVFFDDAEGQIIHTGMLIDRSTIIHCSGMVRIDAIDHQGIFSADVQQYTHNLRLIRRIL